PGPAPDDIRVKRLPGYKKYKAYGNYPNYPKARQIGGSALNTNAVVNIYYNAASNFRTNEATFIQNQLQHIGLTAHLTPSDPTDYYGPLETKGTQYNIAHSGWCADYF